MRHPVEIIHLTSLLWLQSIKTGRLQGLNLKLKALGTGDMSVESSYCTESIFVVEKGSMDLSNIHKNCKIFLMKGNLILGKLDV